jgi:hypothetical protein
MSAAISISNQALSGEHLRASVHNIYLIKKYTFHKYIIYQFKLSNEEKNIKTLYKLLFFCM